MNDFAFILQSAWDLMCTPITLYGYTFSYGQFYLFSLLAGLVAYAIFKIMWG